MTKTLTKDRKEKVEVAKSAKNDSLLLKTSLSGELKSYA